MIGIIPGLGGTVGMSILLPFVFGMDPVSGIGLLVGMVAITQTSDTFSSVLLGVPGTAGSQATIMDGYPLARMGQGRRALSAAFTASGIGGLLGATALLLLIPVARPLVLSFNTPDLFMLTVLGLSLVSILSRGSPLKGLIGGLLGAFLATIGLAQGTSFVRYSGENTYFLDGIPLTILALALFAIPELLNLIREKRSIAVDPSKVLGGSYFTGVRDVFRNKRRVASGSLIGVIMGILPGIGGSSLDWLIYAFTIQTSKDKSQYGKGDIRSVVAVESGNNAKEGGILVPTLLFGIPGSGTGAILLGGLILMGVRPGPDMVTPEGLPLLISVVWSLAIANVVGTTACFLLSTPMALLSKVRSTRMVPIVLVLIFVASYQATYRWWDVITLIVLGTLSWILRQLGWPLVPVLIGFVLGPAAERYLYISMGRYGFSWLTQPSVLIIGALMALIIGSTLISVKRQRNSLEDASSGASGETDGESGSVRGRAGYDE